MWLFVILCGFLIVVGCLMGFDFVSGLFALETVG